MKKDNRKTVVNIIPHSIIGVLKVEDGYSAYWNLENELISDYVPTDLAGHEQIRDDFSYLVIWPLPKGYIRNLAN